MKYSFLQRIRQAGDASRQRVLVLGLTRVSVNLKLPGRPKLSKYKNVWIARICLAAFCLVYQYLRGHVYFPAMQTSRRPTHRQSNCFIGVWPQVFSAVLVWWKQNNSLTTKNRRWRWCGTIKALGCCVLEWLLRASSSGWVQKCRRLPRGARSSIWAPKWHTLPCTQEWLWCPWRELLWVTLEAKDCKLSRKISFFVFHCANPYFLILKAHSSLPQSLVQKKKTAKVTLRKMPSKSTNRLVMYFNT